MNLIALMMLASNPLADMPEVVLLDFTASYCSPCRQMIPAIQSMEKAGFPIRKVDITEHPNISRRFQVEKIPTFILLVNGKETQRLVGKRSEDELRNLMIAARDELRKESAVAEESQPAPEQVQTAAAEERPGGIRGLFQRIRDGLSGRSSKSGFQHPTFRAQSPEPLPADAINEDAMAATVRVRVRKPGDKEDLGTGSVIHSVSETATILTCAHLFHGYVKGSSVDVEIVRDGQTLRYPARIVDGDDQSDLAILQIQTNAALPSVELAPMDVAVARGDGAFSIGCNHGQPPTQMATQVVQINRYNGPGNIVCTVDPAVGRSGGGLFNSSGQLIGVCSCADRDQKEGLYMGRKPIHDLFRKAKLSHLLKPQDKSSAPPSFTADALQAIQDDDIASAFSDDAVVGSEMADDFGFEASLEADAATRTSNEPIAFTASVDETDSVEPVELTVIVGSPNSSQPKEMIVIKRPTPEMLKMLTGRVPAGQQLAVAREEELSSTSASRRTRPAVRRPRGFTGRSESQRGADQRPGGRSDRLAAAGAFSNSRYASRQSD